MRPIDRRAVVACGLLGMAGAFAASAGIGRAATGSYVCPPCGCAMDGREFAGPGSCPACGMTLVPKHQEPAVFEPTELAPGSGRFVVAGGAGHEDKRIGVDYHLPRRFTPDSPLLLVVPGAGRDGDEYRDAWVQASERAGILVASLTYPEADYDFAAYHLGGVVRNLVIRNMPSGPNGETPSRIHLRDEDIAFEPNRRRDQWLFNDFDRIFALLAAAAGSSRTSYDLFGHSAGGQILHRAVLFAPPERADRIVAANSGFYTLPDLTIPLPTGLRDTGITETMLATSLASRLILLLGGEDDEEETRGIQLHTPTIDRQGLGRLARGRHFHDRGREKAADLAVPFNWSLEVVPGVGHDFRAMSRAAALLLYGNNQRQAS